MSLYLLLNLIILAGPLSLSFDKKVAYVKRWPRVLAAASIVAFIYLVWDVAATARGDWSFSYQYAGSARLFGLPAGEYLFFFTVPFSCIFIYEVVKAYFKGKEFRFPTPLIVVLSAAAAAAAVIFRSNLYTFTVLLFLAAFFPLGKFFSLYSNTHFWMFMGISMTPFLIFNGILTSLPVVEYGPQAIWGIRVFSIPLEDFFYNFTLLGYNALLFVLLEGAFSKVRKKELTYG